MLQPRTGASHRPKLGRLRPARRRSHGLPKYAAELEALHRAQGPALREWLDGFFVPDDARILDVGCGDGFYTRSLAERLTSPAGLVVGLDCNAAFLRRARRRADHPRIVWRHADVRQVRFPRGHFDLVFVGQGLRSLRRPERLLHALSRWTRPGGRLLILENDRLHQALLPWSATTELQMKDAELDLAKRSDQDPGVGVGRSLLKWLARAGWEDCDVSPQTVTRTTPLRTDDLSYARLAMAAARRRGWTYLDAEARKELREMVSGRRFREPDGFASYVHLWFSGRKPTRLARDSHAVRA